MRDLLKDGGVRASFDLSYTDYVRRRGLSPQEAAALEPHAWAHFRAGALTMKEYLATHPNGDIEVPPA